MLHQSAHEASGLRLRSAVGPGKLVPGMLFASEHRGDVCATKSLRMQLCPVTQFMGLHNNDSLLLTPSAGILCWLRG